MKNILFFLFLVLNIFCNAQIPVDSVTGKFKYEMVINVDSLNHSVIYDRGKNWIVRTFKSSDNIVNLDDSNKNSINATGNILLSDQSGGLVKYKNVVVNFKFNLYCKDGRYKIIIDNFILHYDLVIDATGGAPNTNSLEGGYKKQGLIKGKGATEKTHKETHDAINKLILELMSTINLNKLPGDKGDW
jgi:hypothetical protein